MGNCGGVFGVRADLFSQKYKLTIAADEIDENCEHLVYPDAAWMYVTLLQNGYGGPPVIEPVEHVLSCYPAYPFVEWDHWTDMPDAKPIWLSEVRTDQTYQGVFCGVDPDKFWHVRQVDQIAYMGVTLENMSAIPTRTIFRRPPAIAVTSTATARRLGVRFGSGPGGIGTILAGAGAVQKTPAVRDAIRW